MAQRKAKSSKSKKKDSRSKKVSTKFVNVTKNEGFSFVVQKRTGKQGKYKYVQISEKAFKKGAYYRIFVRHKATRQKRMLGFGRFFSFPSQSRFRNKLLGGRTFDPKPIPKSAKGKWVPTWKILLAIEDEVSKAGKDLSVQVRGTIVPLRRWYHTEWKVFSDTIRKGTEVMKAIAISVLVHYRYDTAQWVQKRSIVIDLRPRGIRLSKLVTHKDKWQEEATTHLKFEHPNLNIGEKDILSINGFIPLDYIPKGEIK